MGHLPGASGVSWLPSGFSFLSGLPEPARRRRVLIPVQAFVDESGGKRHSRHFVMAGVSSRSEDWALFSDEWRACLDEEPRVATFKMREAARCTGNFLNWEPDKRDERLRRLAAIINKHVDRVTFTVTDLDDHAETWGRTSKPTKDPYFWAYHSNVLATCLSLWEAGLRERFEIIFDEQVIFGPRAKIWYPVVRAVAQEAEPDASSILPVDPMFRADDEFTPLQAADLFAYVIRSRTETCGNQFGWLLDEMKDVVGSKYSQEYNATRMQLVWDESQKVPREGASHDAIMAAIQKIYS